MTMSRPAFETALRLAPQPATRDAGLDEWQRHYAAVALAAWSEFRTTSGEGPLLALAGGLALSAAAALEPPRNHTARLLWDLTPEAGALNGEWEEWLAETLDRLGVNPADIHRDLEPGDWRSPSRSGVAS
jgi:hypothetical protein